MEHQLHDQFFPEADGDGSVLAPLMDPLCTVLYDALRPTFIQLQSLEALCNLVDILQHEVCLSRASSGDVVGHPGTPASPAADLLSGSLADLMPPQQMCKALCYCQRGMAVLPDACGCFMDVGLGVCAAAGLGGAAGAERGCCGASEAGPEAHSGGCPGALDLQSTGLHQGVQSLFLALLHAVLAADHRQRQFACREAFG